MKDNRRQFPKRINGSEKPATVRERWPWVESQVWTDRMLTALESGVKGGKWYCLMDKVLSPSNLQASFAKVAKNDGAPGVDHVSVKDFAKRHESNMEQLHRQLSDGTYHPRAIRRKLIPKPGSKEMRPLGIPTVRDRIVQGALKHVLEPIFEKEFADQSYGFRPLRGCHDALARVEELLNAGNVWVVDADLKRYFDTVPHDALMDLVREKVTDRSVLQLVEMFLKQDILSELGHRTPEEGTPQGGVISPLLANLYLNPLDHRMADAGIEMVRYADDFVVLCRSEAEARQVLEDLQTWTEQAGLTLHPEKTRIVDASQRGGFDFLGYHFERGLCWPSKKSEHSLRDKVRRHTKRNNGHSLETIIQTLNPILCGWFHYYKYSNGSFKNPEGWVRMRLRSILRKRSGRSGRERGSDHVYWPNVFFAKRGLFSLTEAHTLVRQSAER